MVVMVVVFVLDVGPFGPLLLMIRKASRQVDERKPPLVKKMSKICETFEYKGSSGFLFA